MKYMLMIVICIGVSYGCYIFRKTRDILNPILSFSLPIFFSFIVNVLYYDGHGYNISSITYWTYLLGVAGFILGYYVTYRHAHSCVKCVKFEINYNKLFLYFFKLIALFGTCIVIVSIVNGARSGFYGENFIRNLRHYNITASRRDVTILSLIGKYNIVFVDMLFCIYTYRVFVLNDTRKKTKKWLKFSFIGYIIAITASMARTALLQMTLEFIFLFSYGKRTNGNSEKTKIIDKKILVIGIILLCIMQFIAEQTSKAKVIDSTFSISANWMIAYFGEEFYIFDKYIKPNAYVTNGVLSLGPLGRFLHKFNILQPKHAIDTDGGHVASFIAMPYTDFGIFGVFVIMLICGMIMGAIYKRVVLYSGWWTLFYAMCVYSCMIAFFDFQFLMSSHLYLAFLIIILAIRYDGHLVLRRHKQLNIIHQVLSCQI